MDNFVLSTITKPKKLNTIVEFMNSRNIVHTVLRDTQELYDALLTGTCNLHIFDFHMDMSIINTIRDLRDNANNIYVFVTCVDHAQPYLALTDNVYVLPDEFNVMSYFWDSEACSAKNVMAFNTSQMDNIKIIKPLNLGRTKQLSLTLGMQELPLRYKTNDGRIVQTKNTQLVVTCKAKSIDLAGFMKTRDQSEVYTKHKRDLGDLPAAAVDEVEPQTEEPIVKSEPEPEPKPVKEPKPKKQTSGGPDKRTTGLAAIFAKVTAKQAPIAEPVLETEESVTNEAEPETDIIGEPVEEVTETTPIEVEAPAPITEDKETQQPTEKRAPVSFSNFTGGQGSRISAVHKRKITIATTCDSIADYCLENNYISHEDHDKLMLSIQSTRDYSKDAQFGDIALSRGLITEEQLIRAISSVNGIEVLPWSVLEEMQPDFAFFDASKCKQFKFFKLKDTDDSDSVQLIASASISALNSEVKRLFDSPRIRYTLDTFITRKLEEAK